MEIRLLGSIEVAVEGSSDIRIGAAKARWLLAFLALNIGRSRSVESIIQALWGDRAPPSAPNLVQGYISDLRKIIGHESIRTTGDGYCLAAEGVSVDVMRVRELMFRARAAITSKPQTAVALLDEVIDVHVGVPFGEEPPDGPLATASTQLTEQWVDALELRAQLLLNLGGHLEAVTLLDRLVEEHPYREGLWAALAVALYRSDRQVDALRRIAEARHVLQEDLGVSPGRRLLEVERQILDHDAALSILAVPHIEASTSPKMVGRTAELSRLRDRLAQTSGGAQHTVFVGGEPGIGKTTTARELMRTADDDTVVMIGRCDEHLAVPYRPFVEALTEHVRSVGADAAWQLVESRFAHVAETIPSLSDLRSNDNRSTPHGPPMSEMTLLERFDTFAWMLQRAQGDKRLILILEDLHWADSATLRLLHYLTAGHRLPGALVIGTYRTTEPAQLLEDILADLRTEPQVERMLLNGLPATELMLLIPSSQRGSDDEVARWIYRETDGNPFLAVEIINHIAQTGSRDGVPAGVAEVVARRLRRLTLETQTLLRYAAVLGETAPVRLLREFAGVVTDVPAAVAEATQAGILAEEDLDERSYRFTHAILRTAATAAMSVLHLEDLHIAAAEAWASQPGSDGVTVAVASHYLAAGTAVGLDVAVAAFTAAGAESDRTGAKIEAVEWYDRALNRLPEHDPRRASLRLKKFVAAQVAWHWLHGDYGKSTPA